MVKIKMSIFGPCLKYFHLKCWYFDKRIKMENIVFSQN